MKWHQALLGESNQAEEEAQKVCDIILNDARIVALAGNPLLLTTLLFVKRWVGYLPTKKCRLYEEMIKLLLVTWNAAGHDKLDMDETEPQLAFVAYSMTVRGLQKVTKDNLTKYIIDARKAMPELLSYTKISPSQFIDQVEERSSLLIQMGFEETDNGALVPSYEFSHLSFQEYLTAKAVAESWLSDVENQGLLEVLKPHIEEAHWREVVPLAAVLSGRAAKPLIEYLVAANQRLKPNRFLDYEEDDSTPKMAETHIPLHLANCIASEVPMNQEQLESAIILTIKNHNVIERMATVNNFNSELGLDIFTTILKSKYGNNYREIVRRGLFEALEREHIYAFASAWIKIYTTENGQPTLGTLKFLLTKGNYQDKVTAVLLMMEISFDMHNHKKKPRKKYDNILSHICQLLQSDDDLLLFSSTWCCAWAGYNAADIIPHDIVPRILERLVDLWLHTKDNRALKRTISWGIYSVCFPGLKISPTEKLGDAIERHFYHPQNDNDRRAAIHLAVLTGHWTNKKISELVNQGDYPSKMSNGLSRFLVDSGFKRNHKQNSATKSKEERLTQT